MVRDVFNIKNNQTSQIGLFNVNIHTLSLRFV